MNGIEMPVVQHLLKMKQASETDLTESDKGKAGMRKSGSRTDLTQVMVEKDSASKIRNQTNRSRQTQSGPLMPGTVLSQSLSERARNFERFLVS